MSYFVYRSLTPHKKRIRLVHVLPANHRPSIEQDLTQQPEELNPSYPSIANNLICCTISHASLDNAPPFTALSYSWGDQTQRCEILLNGAPISITKNLESALRHLRLQDKPLTLWIDALCIDQSDDVEKGEQIEQMGQIYSEALSVITWLGPAADNSDVAMQWIQRYARHRRLLEKADLCGTESVEGKIQTFIEDLKIQLSQDSAEQLMCVAAVEQLLKRPYWSRVWVVQELVSTSNTLFVCGTEEVTEDALHHSLRLLRNFRRYHTLKVSQDTSASQSQRASIISIDTQHPITLLKFRRATGPFPLIYLMRSLRKFGATDPRDKVFALLGIAGDAEALGLHPDYRKSCEEVYTELALTLIRNGYHDPLSLSDSSRHITGLPSWAPDWSTKSCRHPLQERSLNRSTRPLTTILQPNFSASGIKATLEVPRRDTIIRSMPLLLHGAVLGTVGQLGMVWEGDVGAWLQDLRRLSHLAADTTGLSEGRQKIAWRTAVADQEIRQGNTKPKLSEEKISSVHETLKDKDLSLTQVQTMTDAGLGDYYEQLQVVAQGRRPLLASSGHLGIGPNETQPGDVHVIFLIAQVPYILRRHSEDNTLRLVGEAYVHGLMNGEAMKGSLATEIIPLC
ncbi:Heterokaryon incompatibility protein 6, OR allele [Lachnellula arida]|uniref:Heterokaryon incompatibility protein 6, OR allele n=1 Tax=Lachnellula arida TaxID=1316785 RepID=A0A8T9B8S2_9HELO|nr:Heterokaryon incompatibility protein 6, OR allele [Lachnellula arida]